MLSGANVLVIGADRPDGSIVEDAGRLNALVVPERSRPQPVRRLTHHRVHRSIPMGSEGVGGKRVIYSVRMPRLDKRDILTIKARQSTAIGRLRYSAYVNSEVILAGRPGATHPERIAKRVAALGGRITEANGFNVRAGAERILDALPDPQGRPARNAPRRRQPARSREASLCQPRKSLASPSSPERCPATERGWSALATSR